MCCGDLPTGGEGGDNRETKNNAMNNDMNRKISNVVAYSAMVLASGLCLYTVFLLNHDANAMDRELISANSRLAAPDTR